MLYLECLFRSHILLAPEELVRAIRRFEFQEHVPLVVRICTGRRRSYLQFGMDRHWMIDLRFVAEHKPRGDAQVIRSQLVQLRVRWQGEIEELLANDEGRQLFEPTQHL